MQDELNYGQIMQHALRGVMADTLTVVQENGLPGEHHFYITYDTRHPEVEAPEWLLAEYPESITIVLQYEFHDLTVTRVGFSVRMSFGERPATLYVPFDAVLTFVDPSVEFGLKFEVTEIEPEPEFEEEPEPESTVPEGGAEVLSLDQFRKT